MKVWLGYKSPQRNASATPGTSDGELKMKLKDDVQDGGLKQTNEEKYPHQ